MATGSNTLARVSVGTSGWSYPSWRPGFYPAGLDPSAFLAFYVFTMLPLWSHSAVVLSALPIGSGPFTIAKLYGLEAGVTSGAIFASHVFAVLTVSLLVAWLA